MTCDSLYITILGRSVWALLNAYFSVLEETEFRPGRIVIFAEELFSAQLPLAEKGLRIISKGYGFSPSIQTEQIPETGFLVAGEKISRIVRDAKVQGTSVALDITPGRKALLAGALVSVPKENLDHVFYLAITSTKDAARPYLMIPLQIQDLMDFRRGINEGGAKPSTSEKSALDVGKLPLKPIDRITKGELQVLLNILGDRLKVTFPLTGLEMLQTRGESRGYGFSIPCTPEGCDAAAESFGEFRHEVPNYDDIRSCLIYSGILKYLNEDEFFEFSRAHKKLKKEVVFALDTNLLYFGFPENSGIDASHFLLMETTKSELQGASNRKFKQEDITAFRQASLYNRHLVDDLFNQRTKKARRAAYLALRQYQLIHDRANKFRGIEETSSDNEKNDLILVKSVRQYQIENLGLPILLTADKNVPALCGTEGVDYFCFQIPHEVPGGRCSSAQLVNLIFTLAVVSGFIRLGSVLIYGEFGGKGSNPEELKLVFQDDKLASTFTRNLQICRELITLGIEE